MKKNVLDKVNLSLLEKNVLNKLVINYYNTNDVCYF